MSEDQILTQKRVFREAFLCSSHPRELDFASFRLRFGPFRVRLALFRVRFGVLGGVGLGSGRGASVRENGLTPEYCGKRPPEQ